MSADAAGEAAEQDAERDDAATPDPATVEDLREIVAEQQKIIADQQRAIEDLRNGFEAMRARLNRQAQFLVGEDVLGEEVDSEQIEDFLTQHRHTGNRVEEIAGGVQMVDIGDMGKGKPD